MVGGTLIWRRAEVPDHVQGRLEMLLGSAAAVRHEKINDIGHYWTRVCGEPCHTANQGLVRL